jgi:murein DD-endopeptidase MepM/ murein hydrolase activator NlpD
VNPRNADAHLGLGLIYSDSTKLPEYGYAYYHLNRYVEMAKATNDAIVIPLIQASGLKLAERYATAIGRIQTQGEMEQVRKENSDLRRAVAALTEQLSIAQARLGLAAAATNRPVAAKQVPAPAPAPAPGPTQGPVTRPITQTNPPPQTRRSGISTNRIATSTSDPTTSTTRPAPRAYKVQPRDTLASIAKQNGVGLPQLQAANPGVDSRHLKVGQELRIP